ncbi:tRNA pseudouridine(38-40) synthase TruA [bacterium]|nr:tRNA pseudouridine(38-40) synthase TruA [bacterium]
MRYSLQVQYIGKNYAGSQIQFENGKEIETPTIQGELEKAIRTLIIGGKAENNNRRFKTVFSGRTDRGVNSKGQVIHFDTDKPIVASKFIYHLNEILPNDISVSDLKEVDNKFHAQKSAVKRFYSYEFIHRKYKNAFDGDLLRVKFDIDLRRMQKALNYLLGEHDFSSFKSSGTLNPSRVCFIEKAEIQKIGDKVQIDIVGNRFLYNMVRTIVGTLLEIEGHNLPAEHMLEVLEAKDRRKAGATVSPYGLTLMKVDYLYEVES